MAASTRVRGVSVRAGRCYIKYKDYRGVWLRERTDFTEKEKRKAGELCRAKAQQAKLQRDGLEPLPDQAAESLWSLVSWWIENECPEASRAVARLQMGKHVGPATRIGTTPLRHVTGEALKALFRAMSADGLKAGTVNKVRANLHATFECARDTDPPRWSGRNPVAKTKAAESDDEDRDYDTLRDEEAPLFLACARADWRACFATALWLALRKGELFALLKTDYDAQLRTLRVTKSHTRARTKGKKKALLPVPEPLVPYLEDALARFPGPYLFPDREGRQRTKEADPQRLVRLALTRAGLVTGWRHVCRRCTTPVRKASLLRWTYGGEAAGAELGAAVGVPDVTTVQPKADASQRCPNCQMRLWPMAIERRMRLHDLRHTTATLLLRHGVGIERVSKILRHAGIGITSKTYAHLDVEDMREALKALLPNAADARDEATPVRAVVGGGGGGFGPTLVQAPPPPPPAPNPPANFPDKSEGLGDGPYRVRTCDPYRVNGRDTINRENQPSQIGGSIGDYHSVKSQESRKQGSNHTQFGPPVVQGLRAIGGGDAPLLSVMEVAARLGVSRPLVDRAIDTGQLAAIRIGARKMVHPSDLAAYIARQRGGAR